MQQVTEVALLIAAALVVVWVWLKVSRAWADLLLRVALSDFNQCLTFLRDCIINTRDILLSYPLGEEPAGEGERALFYLKEMSLLGQDRLQVVWKLDRSPARELYLKCWWEWEQVEASARKLEQDLRIRLEKNPEYISTSVERLFRNSFTA